MHYQNPHMQSSEETVNTQPVQHNRSTYQHLGSPLIPETLRQDLSPSIVYSSEESLTHKIYSNQRIPDHQPNTSQVARQDKTSVVEFQIFSAREHQVSQELDHDNQVQQAESDETALFQNKYDMLEDISKITGNSDQLPIAANRQGLPGGYDEPFNDSIVAPTNPNYKRNPTSHAPALPPQSFIAVPSWVVAPQQHFRPNSQEAVTKFADIVGAEPHLLHLNNEAAGDSSNTERYRQIRIATQKQNSHVMHGSRHIQTQKQAQFWNQRRSQQQSKASAQSQNKGSQDRIQRIRKSLYGGKSADGGRGSIRNSYREGSQAHYSSSQRKVVDLNRQMSKTELFQQKRSTAVRSQLVMKRFEHNKDLHQLNVLKKAPRQTIHKTPHLAIKESSTEGRNTKRCALPNKGYVFVSSSVTGSAKAGKDEKQKQNPSRKSDLASRSISLPITGDFIDKQQTNGIEKRKSQQSQQMVETEEIYSDPIQAQYQHLKSQEKIRVFLPEKGNFKVAGFQNSLRSKAEQEARRSSQKSSQYGSFKHSRKDKWTKHVSSKQRKQGMSIEKCETSLVDAADNIHNRSDIHSPILGYRNGNSLDASSRQTQVKDKELVSLYGSEHQPEQPQADTLRNNTHEEAERKPSPKRNASHFKVMDLPGKDMIITFDTGSRSTDRDEHSHLKSVDNTKEANDERAIAIFFGQMDQSKNDSSKYALSRKLEENVYRERKAIFKRNEQVRQHLQDTQIYIEQPEQKIRSKSSFAVQNVELAPRRERGSCKASDFVKDKGGIYYKVALFSTGDQHPPIQVNSKNTNSQNNVTNNFVKRYQQLLLSKKRMQNRRQQPEIDESNLNESMQIRQTFSQSKKDNSAKKGQRMFHKNVSKEIQANNQKNQEYTDQNRAPGDNSTEMITDNDSQQRLQKFQEVQKEPKAWTIDQIASDDQSSHLVHTESRNEINMKNSQGPKSALQRQSHQNISYRPEKLEDFHLQGSKVLQKNTNNQNQHSQIVLKRNIPVKNGGHFSLPQDVSTSPKFIAKQDVETAILANAKERRATEDGDTPTLEMKENPYRMTEEEKDHIREKNRNLIQQFQNPINYSNAYQQQHQNLDSIDQLSLLGKERHRASHGSDGTLYSVVSRRHNLSTEEAKQALVQTEPKIKTSVVNSTSGSQKGGAEQNNNKAKIRQKDISPLINKDIKVLLKNTISDNNSHDGDITPPAQLKPVHDPKSRDLTLRENLKDDFNTTQISNTYREHEPIGANFIEYKDRPASSTERGQKEVSLKVDSIQNSSMQKIKQQQKIHTKTKIKGKKKEGGQQITTSSIDVSNYIDKQALIEPSENDVSTNPQPTTIHQISFQPHVMSQDSQQTVTLKQIVSVSEYQQKDSKADKESMINPFRDLCVQQVMSMNHDQIDTLNFEQICQSQKLLFDLLNQLQRHLSEVFITRGSSAANVSYMENQRFQSEIQLMPSVDGVKKCIYKTKYASQGPYRGLEMPISHFTREQRELRQQLVEQQRQLYRGEQKKEQQLNLQQKAVKFKLISSDEIEDEPSEMQPQKANQYQKQIDSFEKFKQKQQKVKMRRERIRQEQNNLKQCSAEEYYLLSQINVLMQKQDMLYRKAKQIQSQDMDIMKCDHIHSVETTLADLNDQNIAIAKMEKDKQDMQKFNLNSLLDRKHRPSPQRLSSRQSLHKINYSLDRPQEKSLIVVANEKLNSINRRSSTKGDHISSHQSTNKMDSSVLVTLTQNEQLQDIKKVSKFDNLKRPSSENQGQLMLRQLIQSKLADSRIGGGNIGGTLKPPKVKSNQQKTSSKQNQQLHQTINLYLQKVSNDSVDLEASSAAITPVQNAIGIQQNSSKEDSLENFAAAHKSTVRQPSGGERQAETQRKAHLKGGKLSVRKAYDGSGEKYDTQPGDLEVSALNSPVSESPINKHKLIQHDDDQNVGNTSNLPTLQKVDSDLGKGTTNLKQSH